MSIFIGGCGTAYRYKTELISQRSNNWKKHVQRNWPAINIITICMPVCYKTSTFLLMRQMHGHHLCICILTIYAWYKIIHNTARNGIMYSIYTVSKCIGMFARIYFRHLLFHLLVKRVARGNGKILFIGQL